MLKTTSQSLTPAVLKKEKFGNDDLETWSGTDLHKVATS